MKIRIGIDIGKTGGLAVFTDDICTLAVCTPQIGDEIDVTILSKIIERCVAYDGYSIHACIEDVHSIYGASAKSNFQFGRAAGIIEGILHSFKVPFTAVTPKTWQKDLWQGVDVVTKVVKGKVKNDTKAMSLIAVKRLYPNLCLNDNPRARTPHDGLVDAVLIATYCNRKF